MSFYSSVLALLIIVVSLFPTANSVDPKQQSQQPTSIIHDNDRNGTSYFSSTATIFNTTSSPGSRSTLYPITLSATGSPFYGIGAQSTAGTARLLIDYSIEQRNEILDLLFLPQYGAALQHFKVEIGGGAQISCGAEISGMNSPNR